MDTKRKSLIACLMVAIAGTTSSQELNRLKPGTYREVWTPIGTIIVIDGQEHPEAIPDHSAWRAVFSMAAHAKRDGGATLVVLKQRLKGMSEEELQILLTEAAAQVQRGNDCQKRTSENAVRMVADGARLSEIGRKGLELIVACRQEVLDASDRVLAALTPEGQAILADYLQYKRTTTTLDVPANELKDLYRPR